jgi:hypothetical protein
MIQLCYDCILVIIIDISLLLLVSNNCYILAIVNLKFEGGTCNSLMCAVLIEARLNKSYSICPTLLLFHLLSVKVNIIGSYSFDFHRAQNCTNTANYEVYPSISIEVFKLCDGRILYYVS